MKQGRNSITPIVIGSSFEGKDLVAKREKFRPEKQLLWKLSRNKKSEDIVPESV